MTNPHKTRRSPNHIQAITVLKRARDLLVQRLTDAVLEMGDDLLEDARGDSFAGEIDTLHERLGLRLNQINVILSGLAGDDDSDDAEEPRRQAGRKYLRTDASGLSEQHDLTSHSTRGNGPGTDTERPVAPHTTVDSHPSPVRFTASSYPLFVQDIVRRDVPAAGRRLAEVLGVPASQGEAYSVRFRDQLDRDPGFLAKVHTLRQALQADNTKTARILLRECFGLEGHHCQDAIRLLKSWL